MGNGDDDRACLANSATVGFYAEKLAMGHWSFLGPGSETKWAATDTIQPGGGWDRVATLMMESLSTSGHAISEPSLDPGQLKSKGNGKLSFHFCADEATIETIFRTIISVD